MEKLQIRLADGSNFNLTRSKHNELQIDILEKFVGHYVKNALVLYLSDAANEFVIYDKERLKQLGVPATNHDKLPDIILYREDKNWLYLIEAFTSHGPISKKRLSELEQLFQHCKAARLYITAIPLMQDLEQYAEEIVWGTKVWVAEAPEHLIDFE
jgi:BsuBI/PstI restriction endonuclease domain